MRLYQYRGLVTRVVDGDTVWIDLDLGLRIHQVASCRLFGINAPELSSGVPGAEAKTWLTARLAGKTVWVQSSGLDKYGRPLVTVFEPEPGQDIPMTAASVNQELVAAGLAVPYMVAP